MRTLKQAIMLSGLSQQRLANLVGITANQLCNIKSGRSFPRKGTRIKFEKKLGEIDWQETFDRGKFNNKL